MTEFSQISLREAREATTTALGATERLINRAAALHADRLKDELDAAAQDLAGALQRFEAASKLLSQKAGLLPDAGSEKGPAF